MDSEHNVYLARAQNELNLSLMVVRVSDEKICRSQFLA